MMIALMKNELFELLNSMLDPLLSNREARTDCLVKSRIMTDLFLSHYGIMEIGSLNINSLRRENRWYSAHAQWNI